MLKKIQKKIKVCQVTSADITLRFLLFSQMKRLQESGFEVWAVSSPGVWTSDIERLGIRFCAVSITRKIFTPFTDCMALFSLVKLFREERFDIVHTHTLKASFLGQLASLIAGIPIRLYTMHGLDFQGVNKLWRRILFRSVERFIARVVHGAFSVNKEDIAMALQKRIYTSSEKLVYLPIGVNLQVFNPDRFSQEFVARKKQKLGINRGVQVIGIVARLVREKGYFELFEAFATILKRFPNTVLLVVGPIEEDKQDGFNPKEAAQAFEIHDKVLFLGMRTDMPELYALMDLFVLPTWREGLGVSILEASAMKKPVVSSMIRGCIESAEHNKTAILLPPKNPRLLAEAIVFLLSNPDRRKTMGEQGRRKVEREFNESTILQHFTEEYNRLIQGRL